MKLFVSEFVTGGGMGGEVLPASLAHEADLMVRTLLADLALVPGVELLTSRDPRLPPIPGIATLSRHQGESFHDCYRRGLAQVDAAWPTAPESGGALLALARLTRSAGRVLLGSSPDAIALTGSKRRTVARLVAAGIAAVPTAIDPEEMLAGPGAWIVKPDDGAGCEDTTVVADRSAAAVLLASKPAGAFVAQPWLEGDSLSLSLLCRDGGAQLLSINRQRMVRLGDGLRLAALEVNALPDQDGIYQQLAGRVAETIPGLWGYVGVDLIATPGGPVILEINPRLTTSYCGLRQALGINLPALVLGLQGRWPTPDSPAERIGHSVVLPLEVVGDA